MIRVADQELPWREDLTISDILREVGDNSHYVVARINEEYIPHKRFSTKKIPDGATVYFIDMVAGG